MNADAVRALLPEPEFGEAAGVLEMIARTPEQESLYQARLKFQRDAAARLEYARAQGREEGQQWGEKIGRAQGERIGQLQLLEKLLGLPTSSSDELANEDLEELSSKVAELQRRLTDRSSN